MGETLFITDELHAAVLRAVKRHQRKGAKATRTAVKVGGQIVGWIVPLAAPSTGYQVTLSHRVALKA